MLNRVGHTHTDFGYLLVIHLMVQSAYGFKCLAQENSLARAGRDLAWTLLIFAVLFLTYALGTRHQPVPWSYILTAAAGGIGAPWLFLFLKLRSHHISWAGWCGIVLLGFLPHFRFGLYTGGNDELLMIPGPRVALNLPLPSLNRIQEDHTGAFRVVGLNGHFAGGDYAAVYGLEDIRSCAPVSSGKYIGLLQNFPGMSFGQDWVIAVKDPFKAQPLLNLLNVKYLLADPQKKLLADSVNYTCVFPGQELHDFMVLENRKVWPRAFFANKIVPVTSDQQFSDYLLKNGDHPFIAMSQEEIVRQPGLQPLVTAPQPAIVAATNYMLLPNSTAFDIHCPSPGVVCLTEGQPKSFRATANGRPQPVLTVNQAFKGIYLDQAGDYHIEFSFRPRHWGEAVLLFWISALSVIGLAAGSAWRRGFGHKSCEAKV